MLQRVPALHMFPVQHSSPGAPHFVLPVPAAPALAPPLPPVALVPAVPPLAVPPDAPPLSEPPLVPVLPPVVPEPPPVVPEPPLVAMPPESPLVPPIGVAPPEPVAPPMASGSALLPQAEARIAAAEPTRAMAPKRTTRRTDTTCMEVFMECPRDW